MHVPTLPSVTIYIPINTPTFASQWFYSHVVRPGLTDYESIQTKVYRILVDTLRLLILLLMISNLVIDLSHQSPV